MNLCNFLLQSYEKFLIYANISIIFLRLRRKMILTAGIGCRGTPPRICSTDGHWQSDRAKPFTSQRGRRKMLRAGEKENAQRGRKEGDR
jgi:hypothetical protein